MVIHDRFIDINEFAKVPLSLKSYVNFDGIYPPEKFDGHIETYKNYHLIKNFYQIIDSVPRELIDNYTLERIKILVGLALKNFRFYRKLYKNVGFELGDLKTLKDVSMLPMITKKDLNELYIEACQNQWIEITHESRTSGSNGEPVSIIKDISAKRYSYAQLMVIFENMMQSNFKSSDFIYSIYHEPWMHTSILGDIKFFTVDIHAPLTEILEHIYSLKPTVITGFGSKVLELAEMIGKPYHGLKLLSTNSEYTSPLHRKQLSERLGIPIRDEYSSEELETIAWETEDGFYKVAEDSVYLELTHAGSRTMNCVVGTDLLNYTVPKIRYIQGDFAEWLDIHPKCGFRKLSSFSGREDMNLICPVNGIINSSIILDLIDSWLIPIESRIKKFLIVQEDFNTIKLYILPQYNCEINKYYIENFRTNFYKYFDPIVTLLVLQTSEFPNIGNKRRMVVRRFNVQ